MSVVPAPRTTVRLDVDTLLYLWVGWALYTCHVLREGKVKAKGRSQHRRGEVGFGGETKLWGSRGWSEETDQRRGG